MDKRQAKRCACLIASELIERDLLTGVSKLHDYSYSFDDDERIENALDELVRELNRRGKVELNTPIRG